MSQQGEKPLPAATVQSASARLLPLRELARRQFFQVLMSPSMFWVAVALMAAFNVAMAGSTAHSFGMIVSCPATLAVEEDCLWAGDNGELLSSLSLSSLLLHRHLDRPESHKQAARNLKTHMTYIEGMRVSKQHHVPEMQAY